MTSERSVDAEIEVAPTGHLRVARKIVAPGGTIANIGLDGTKVALIWSNLWERNITITTRLVDTVALRYGKVGDLWNEFSAWGAAHARQVVCCSSP